MVGDVIVLAKRAGEWRGHPLYLSQDGYNNFFIRSACCETLRACVRACVRAFVRASVRVHVCVCAHMYWSLHLTHRSILIAPTSARKARRFHVCQRDREFV